MAIIDNNIEWPARPRLVRNAVDYALTQNPFAFNPVGFCAEACQRPQEVASANNSDHPFIFNNRKALDAVLFHHVGEFAQRSFGHSRNYLPRHHVTHALAMGFDEFSRKRVARLEQFQPPGALQLGVGLDTTYQIAFRNNADQF
jgi:hypothetical protein